MRSLVAIAALLLTACSLHAGFPGFEVGNGVAMTGGVVRVTFNFDKRHSLSLGRALRLTIMEVRLTQVTGRVKRQTILSAGTHTLRVPLPIELTEVLGSCSLLALIGIIIITLNWRLRPAETGTSPSDGAVELLENSDLNGRASSGERLPRT
jgi:hypothetical protein